MKIIEDVVSCWWLGKEVERDGYAHSIEALSRDSRHGLEVNLLVVSDEPVIPKVRETY